MSSHRVWPCEYEEGSPSAPICLLGEAPSTEEMKQHSPFVGQSGKVLDTILAQAGISRSDCYITNCYETPVRKTVEGKIKADTPPPAKVFDRLDACTSNIIVPLGNIALNILAPSTKGAIGKWRGSVIEARGRKIMATYHPATVVWGNTQARHIIATDLARAKEQSEFPDIRRRERRLHVEPTFMQTMEFIHHCSNMAIMGLASHVFWDVELYAGCLSALSLSCEPGESMSIPFINEDRRCWWNPLEEQTILTCFGNRVLAEDHCPKGNQNIGFDMWIMWKLYGMATRGRIDDSMILHHVVFPDFSKGLDFLCSWLTDQPYYKDDGGSRLWADPWKDLQRFWRYSALDACIALECFQGLKKDYLQPSSPWLTSYENALTLIEPLIFMEMRGMKIDLAGFRQERARLKKELVEVELALDYLAPGLNYASPKQCVDFFYTKAGVQPYVNRKSGKPTTDDLALSRLARKGNKAAQLVLDCRGIKKALMNYEEVKTSSGRLHCSYNIRGTKTDRLSSSATVFGDGGNMQNLPGEFLNFLMTD